MKPA
jgi:hypothetical protein